jgi:hypothetical protein
MLWSGDGVQMAMWVLALLSVALKVSAGVAIVLTGLALARRGRT